MVAGGGWLAVAGFELVGVIEGHTGLGLADEAFAAKAGEETADGFAGEAGHAAELFVGELHAEGDWEVGGRGSVVAIVFTGPVEKGAGKLTGGGGLEGEPAGGENCTVVVADDGLGDAEAYFGVGIHEVEEAVAGDGFDDGGGEGFCGDAIEGVLEQGGEAEEVTGGGYAEEEEAAIEGGGDQLDATSANDEDVVGGEAFADEDFMGVVMVGDAEGVEVAQGWG